MTSSTAAFSTVPAVSTTSSAGSSVDTPMSYANSTRTVSTTTITISGEIEADTRTTTIQSTSFTTHTITITVQGIPAVVFTTKTSVFPNISDASVSEEWMTATGRRLSCLRTLTDSNGELPKSGGIDSTTSSSDSPTESERASASTISHNSSSSSYSEGSTMGSLTPSPAAVTAITTSHEASSDSPSSSAPSPSASSNETSVPAASTTFSPASSMTISSSSWTTAASSESAPTKTGNVVAPFIVAHPTFSSDCPSTVDCATWSPDMNQGIMPTRALRYSIHKRDTSWSALDARGYAMLVAWFIVGAVAGVMLVLIVSRFRTWQIRRKSVARRIVRPAKRANHTWGEGGLSRRRGSTSPTHVSGMESLSQDKPADSRLLRRSWQEDSVV